MEMRRIAAITLAALLVPAVTGSAEPGEFAGLQWRGWSQIRAIDQLDGGDDDLQLTRARLIGEKWLDDHTRIFIHANESWVDEEWSFSWIDAYVGVRWDERWRSNIGLAHVPFGFDNIQPTFARVPLQQSMLASRTMPGKRDVGVYVSYSSPEASRRFAELLNAYHGSGNHGLFALGIYGGMGRTDNPEDGTAHLSLRAAVPLTAGGETIGEAGTSFFTGKYATRSAAGDRVRIEDEQWGAHLFLAPRPFGLQAEYLTGTMPGLAATGETMARSNDGWYAMGLWEAKEGVTVFLRAQEFDGWVKRRDAQPAPFDYDARTLGVRWDATADTAVTLEYDDVTLNSNARDFWALQWQQMY